MRSRRFQAASTAVPLFFFPSPGLQAGGIGEIYSRGRFNGLPSFHFGFSPGGTKVLKLLSGSPLPFDFAHGPELAEGKRAGRNRMVSRTQA